MIIDLSCPVELRGYELLRDDHGSTRAYIRLFNLSERTVTGYSATVQWYNALTNAADTENISVDEVEIPPRSFFKFVHSTKSDAEADHVEMYFSSVIFSDGETWTPRDGDLVDVGEQPVLEGEELDLLQEAAGEDAVQFPQVQNKYWRCVCGRINLLDRETCLRCRRDRNDVLKNLNSKAVLGARKPKSRVRRAARTAPRANKKRKSDAFLKAVMIALLIILFALIGYGIGKGRGADSAALTQPTSAPVVDSVS